jgi:glycosyltransferase involved in cell wall biosynthesis
MKICFYSTDNKILTYDELQAEGGSGTLSSMLYVAKGLSLKGVVVEVLGSYKETKIENNITYKSINNICNVISYSINFDVFVYVGHCGSEISCRLKAKKVFYWAHNWLDSKRYFLLLKNNVIDNIIFVGYYQLFQSIFSGAKSLIIPFSKLSKLTVIPNAIDFSTLSQFENRPSDIKSQHLAVINIAFIGFPSKNKGFDKACELAFSIRRDSSYTIKFHVFGGASLYSLNKPTDDSLFKGLEVIESDTVQYGTIGRLDLYDKISKVDLVVSGLNGSETFCLSLMEACAIGVPVITCDVGGQTEFLRHGDNAYILSFMEPYKRSDVNEIIKFVKGYKINNKSNLNIKKTYTLEKVSSKWLVLITGGKLTINLKAMLRAFRSLIVFILKRSFR